MIRSDESKLSQSGKTILGKSVIICGDRYWTDKEPICSWLSKLLDWGYETLIVGDARGADRIACEEAARMNYPAIHHFSARWGSFGRAAGPIRNREMLKLKPDLIVAFHPDISKSRGTANMIKQAKEKGVPWEGVPVELVTD